MSNTVCEARRKSFLQDFAELSHSLQVHAQLPVWA